MTRWLGPVRLGHRAPYTRQIISDRFVGAPVKGPAYKGAPHAHASDHPSPLTPAPVLLDILNHRGVITSLTEGNGLFMCARLRPLTRSEYSRLLNLIAVNGNPYILILYEIILIFI